MAKKPKRKRKPSKRYAKYKVEAGKLVKPRFCPRCGSGVLLAISKNRLHCGKCHYTEFLGKEVKEE